MFLIKSFLTMIENYFVLSLIISVILLAIVYFSNYIRVCYYVSKIPGPKAYPIVGNGLSLLGSHADIADYIFHLAVKFDKIGRIWLGFLPAVFIMSPENIQQILTNRHSLEKPWLMTNITFDLARDSIINTKVSKWKHNRSQVLKGFSPIILKSYFKVFVEKILILSDKLSNELNGEKPFDIFEYLSKTTLDAVCGSTMGVQIHAQEHETSYFNSIQTAFQLMFDRACEPWVYINFVYNLTPNGKHLQECKDVVWGFANQIISQKRNKRDDSNTKSSDNTRNISKTILKEPLLNQLLDMSQNDPNFTDQQLTDEITLIIIAGYETTANAMSYMLLNLATHKDIQTKVYDELISVFGNSDRTVELGDLSELKYMEMVIKETLRLYTTVPLIGRELTADISIDKYILPKGVTCIIPLTCYHRNPNVWENPLKFDPERFTPEKIKERHPYAYIPFSAGPRNCIGIRYAIMFMKTLIATILRKYEFHTDINLDQIKLEMVFSLKLVGGHQVKITPRNTKFK